MNDLMFLLVFIVLPTALIVSGFWAILLFKRGPRRTEEVSASRRYHSAAATEPADQTTAVEEPVSQPAMSKTAIEESGATANANGESGSGTAQTGAGVEVIPDEPEQREQMPVQPTTEIPMVEEADEQRQQTAPDGDPETDDTAVSRPYGSTNDTGEPVAGGPAAPQQDNGPDHHPADATKPQTSELGSPPEDPDESEPEDSGRARQQRTWSVTRMKPGEDANPRPSRLGKSSSRRVPRLGRRSGRRHQR